MSPSELTSDTDGVAIPRRRRPDSAGKSWSAPALQRLPLPAAAATVYAGIRVFDLMVTAFMLQHGRFRKSHVSLARFLTSGDGRWYQAIAAHGYQYDPSQLAHSRILSFLPGYPAAIDALAWLPGVSIVLAGFAVTILAGLAAAWGVAALGVKLTADLHTSLLMVAMWALAPSSVVLSRLYAEALFCALAVWALVALVSRHWLTAGVLVILAGTVRITALALVAAVAVAAAIALAEAARRRQRIAVW